MGPVGGRGGHLADRQKLEEVGQSRLASDEDDGELSSPAAGVYVIDSCFIVQTRHAESNAAHDRPLFMKEKQILW